MAPIAGFEPTYSRFLNALQDIFGIVEWNLRLNSLRHLPFVLKWTYSGWDGRIRTCEMLESKSSALPLGYIPIIHARLFPNCQCLFHSHGVVSPANVCVFSPHRHGSIPVVRKEITMNTIATIGSTTNPTP